MVIIYIDFHVFLACVHLLVRVCAPWHGCGGRRQLAGVSSVLHHVDVRNQTQDWWQALLAPSYRAGLFVLRQCFAVYPMMGLNS